MSRKNRLDVHMVNNGIVSSREKAQQLIRSGKVRDNSGQILDKPGQGVSQEITLIIKDSPRFVSRGGEKLLAALDAFPIKIEGRVCLDGGISTGGFTDCLLQHGAKRIYGIDVGYGQTAWKLRINPQVFIKERTNLRTLTSDELYSPNDPLPSLAVADLSFISLRLVLPAIKQLMDPSNPEAVVLVKPQFEVGRELVGKGGVVRSPQAHIDALTKVIEAACALNWIPRGIVASPLTGPAGNHEYLLWLGNDDNSETLPNLENLVVDTLA